MRISDWISDVCSSDLNWSATALVRYALSEQATLELGYARKSRSPTVYERYSWGRGSMSSRMIGWFGDGNGYVGDPGLKPERADTVSAAVRSEEHTSELQSLMRISYAVFCLKKKKRHENKL